MPACCWKHGRLSLHLWFVSLLLLQSTNNNHAATVGWKFAVIIDAGSTGSRVHVYRYRTTNSNNSPWAAVELPEAVQKTTPGLSSYAASPDTAAKSLQPLLKYAKEKVPEGQWQTTPIQLMATAGLRMMKQEAANAVLTAVRSTLSQSGFAFQPVDGARVLTGRDEGLWGWVGVNYATGALQAVSALDVSASQLLLGRKGVPAASASTPSPAAPLQGVLELGGASMQVTFMPKEQLPAAQAAPLSLPGLGAGRIYSHSFDGLGLQAAHSRWKDKLSSGPTPARDPCLLRGYTSAAGVHGYGDWKACRAAVKQLVPINRTCAYQQCGLAGMYLPKVDGAVFLGLDNFYYTAVALGLPTNKHISVGQIDKAAHRFCSQNWRAVRSKYLQSETSQDKDTSALKVCFSSALILTLLQDGLHLDPSAAILTASNSVLTPKGRAIEVNWVLGALVIQVLKLGGRPISKAHDHPYVASVGSSKGASDVTAAATAGGFCVLLLLLTSCAAYLKVGVSMPATASSVAAVRLSVPIQSLSLDNHVSTMASAFGGLLQQAAALQPGMPSNVKYQRMRAVSPTNGASTGFHRQGAAPQWAGSGGRASGGGMNGAPIARVSCDAVDESRLAGGLKSSTMHVAKHR